jgi:hypothetical protein
MAYAQRTQVPVEQSRNEIERILAKYGARSFAYFVEPQRAIIYFEAKDRRIRFELPLPQGETTRDAQARRQKWRALTLCIKAKLESVEGKIETFEAAFLAHVVMPDGMTVGQHTSARIAEAYSNGEMRPLLPAPETQP